ncbi:hypothetical protein [Nioella aestuarii]|uniref:hypothetical protein n=1 Tax=Nioella aestuarii TaxID=1662864 RepID=UPI003D7FF0A5
MKCIGQALLTATIIAIGTPSTAQSFVTVRECTAALEGGDTEAARGLAEEILEWERVPAQVRTEAERCLTEVFGVEYEFYMPSRGFLTADEVEQLELPRVARLAEQQAEEGALQAAIRAEEEALQAARCQILEELAPLQLRLNELMALEDVTERNLEIAANATRSETLQTCRDWYSRDRFSALTNSVCSDYFERFGAVPPEGMDDYDQAELRLIRAQVSRLNLDLQTIDEGMLPEDARMERLELLRLAAISELPEELQQQAQNMSVAEIEVLRIAFEREQCD